MLHLQEEVQLLREARCRVDSSTDSKLNNHILSVIRVPARVQNGDEVKTPGYMPRHILTYHRLS